MNSQIDSEIDISIATAERLYNQGRPGEALAILHRLPPVHGALRERVLLIVGASFARMKRREEARRAFQELLQLNPDSFEALTWVAVLLRNSQEIDQAIAYAKRAIQLQPDNALGHSSLGSCFLFLRQPTEAIRAFQLAVELAPDAAELEHNLAQAYLMDHQHGEAIQRFRRAILLAPFDSHSYLTLARVYMLYGMAGEALECLESGLIALPDCAELHSSAGAAFAMIRNDEAAERHHRRAVELSNAAEPDYASWLLNQGRFEEAGSHFLNLIQSDRDPAFGYYGLMQTKKLASGDEPFVADMRSVLNRRSLRKASRMYLSYALGRAEEQLNHGGEAMSHFDEANALAFEINHSAHPVDPNSFVEDHARVQALFEQLRTGNSMSDSGASPIFIVGMIRSGTTLLDQIVSSHPDVTSAGELRFWIEEALRLAATPELATPEKLNDLAETYLRYGQLLVGSEVRFTDKMPLNFAYVGVIRAAFPNAKFLHIRRHPVDTCLSIYTTYFGKGALFAYKKSNIVAYFKAYLASMEYWRQNLQPQTMFELDYEDLVTDPDTVIPQVIEFCGLPWSEACLRHHENKSAINTPSRWQARQPMYLSSTERWKRYEPWLGEFTELLA